MAFEWDPEKARLNFAKHGLAFEAARQFDVGTAATFDDIRADYGERREIAIGFIGDRLCVMAFTRRGERTRIISLRKANAREKRRYVDHLASR
jgi:uncharacterized DUF497 family protein